MYLGVCLSWGAINSICLVVNIDLEYVLFATRFFWENLLSKKSFLEGSFRCVPWEILTFVMWMRGLEAWVPIVRILV